MALAVICVVMSIAVVGTRWTVAPTTGWPGLVASPEPVNDNGTLYGIN